MHPITALARATAPEHAKAAPLTTAPIIQRAAGSTVERVDWNEEEAINRGLDGNVWVSAAVRIPAQAASKVPIVVSVRKGDEWVPVDTLTSDRGKTAEAARELQALIEEPNSKMDRSLFVWHVRAKMDITGNALAAIAPQGKPGPEAKPSALWPLPLGFAPIKSPHGYAEGYRNDRMRSVSGAKSKYSRDEVVHWMYPSLGSFAWGTAPLRAAAETVDADVEAQVWNRVAMQRRAVADIIVSLDGYPTVEQYAVARERLDEEVQGARNAGGAMLLPGGAKPHKTDRSPVEMDFLATQKFTVQKVSAAFNILPALLSPEAATYSNLQGAIEHLWKGNVVPWLDSYCGVLRRELLRRFGDPKLLWISPDLSAVEALQGDMTKKAATLKMMIDAGVPYNEAIRILDLDLPPIDGDGDLPHGVSLVSTIARVRGGGQLSAAPAIGKKETGPESTKAARIDLLQPLWRLAERTADRVAKLYRDLARELRSGADTERVQAAIESGDTGAVLQAAGLDRLRDGLTALEPEVRSAAVVGAETGVGQLSRELDRDLRVDAGLVALWGQQTAADAGGLIVTSSEEGVSEAVASLRDRELDGSTLAKLAGAFALLVAVNSQQGRTAIGYFLDLLASGMAGSAAAGKLERMAERMVRERAALIGTDLGQRAAWGGQRQGLDFLRQTQQVREIYRAWVDSDDAKVCPECMGLDEQTVSGDELYLSPTSGAVYAGPPDPHPGSCRCGEVVAEAVV